MLPVAAVVAPAAVAAEFADALSVLGRRRFVDELEGFFNQDFPRHLTQRRTRDVVVPWEAVKIDFGKDIAKGFIREPEEEIVLPVHLALEIKADVRQGFTGNGKNLGVAQIDEINSSGH